MKYTDEQIEALIHSLRDRFFNRVDRGTLIDILESLLAERQAAMQGQGGDVVVGGTIRFDEDHWYRTFRISEVDFLAPLEDQDKARLILQGVQS